VYLEYLGKDVMITYRLFRRLRRQLERVLRRSEKVWGFVSEEWLDEQISRWGPSTHHIQLKAAIVLRDITAAGLHVNPDHRDRVSEELQLYLEDKAKVLRTYFELRRAQCSEPAPR
jgi:hypothetical protein